MISNYKILTLSYEDVTLDKIPMYMVSSEHSDEERTKLSQLKNLLDVQELYYLNTCNRVLYLVYSQHSAERLMQRVKPLVYAAGHKNTENISDLSPKIYEGEEAVNHFFEVASSLNSMVVGEREIIRQVKEAYEKCLDYGLTGDHLRILYQSCIQTGKAVYSHTRIGEKAVSVVALAMKKMRQMGLSETDEVILIGAGQSIKNVCRFLAEWGVTKIKIFNRSLFNAHKLKEICPTAEFYPLSEIHLHNLDVDFFISCTGASNPVLTPEIIATATQSKGLTKTKGMLDLAIPNDIHSDIFKEYPKIRLIEVESLRSLAQKNINFRKKEILKAKEIVDQQIAEFKEKMHRRFIEKAFHDIPSLIHEAKDKAINEVYRQRMDDLDPETQDLIHEMMDYMAKKCISIPMKTAKEKYSFIRKSLS
ncbi:glutamyl-tRNA reductase [Membranihabitans marinus]|uniref:glutamyl-tRNA reductase n=1 Tax=Membranihabitans marinus TaxID=1227546 RepID=UPI001EFFA7EA|nr:glutamyl-tRNA reductase [Membranihabitans marinus]